MTKIVNRKKRARVQYPCPFCLSIHYSSASITFCEKNPDREANRKKRSELNRASYEKSGARERLKAATNNEVVRIKRSINTKKMWEDGRLGDTAGEKNGMYGKKHKLESRMKTSISMTKAQKESQPARIRANIGRDLERENIATPVFGTSEEFFGKKMDKDGWVEVDDGFSNFGFDDFDPFR